MSSKKKATEAPALPHAQDESILAMCHSLRSILVDEISVLTKIVPDESRLFASSRAAANTSTSALQSGFSLSDLYMQTDKWFANAPSLLDGAESSPNQPAAETLAPAEAQRLEALMQKDKLRGIEKEAVVTRPDSKTQKQKKGRQERAQSAGKGWFDLPLQEPTEEMKQELQVLRLRSYADPKKFFKKGDKELPKYFEVGRVIAGPTDFYSADRPGKAKGGASSLGLVDELLQDQKYRKYAKRKFREIQEKRSGAGRRRKRVKV